MTEGAVGYRRFGIVSGQKAMAVLSLADGDVPPFGAVVQNHDHIQTGMVSEDGMVWLSGINPEETMQVSWGGDVQCEIRFLATIPTEICCCRVSLRRIRYLKSQKNQ